jgi:hypothetical protein
MLTILKALIQRRRVAAVMLLAGILAPNLGALGYPGNLTQANIIEAVGIEHDAAVTADPVAYAGMSWAYMDFVVGFEAALSVTIEEYQLGPIQDDVWALLDEVIVLFRQRGDTFGPTAT